MGSDSRVRSRWPYPRGQESPTDAISFGSLSTEVIFSLPGAVPVSALFLPVQEACSNDWFSSKQRGAGQGMSTWRPLWHPIPHLLSPNGSAQMQWAACGPYPCSPSPSATTQRVSLRADSKAQGHTPGPHPDTPALLPGEHPPPPPSPTACGGGGTRANPFPGAQLEPGLLLLSSLPGQTQHPPFERFGVPGGITSSEPQGNLR